MALFPHKLYPEFHKFHYTVGFVQIISGAEIISISPVTLLSVRAFNCSLDPPSKGMAVATEKKGVNMTVIQLCGSSGQLSVMICSVMAKMRNRQQIVLVTVLPSTVFP